MINKDEFGGVQLPFYTSWQYLVDTAQLFGYTFELEEIAHPWKGYRLYLYPPHESVFSLLLGYDRDTEESQLWAVLHPMMPAEWQEAVLKVLALNESGGSRLAEELIEGTSPGLLQAINQRLVYLWVRRENEQEKELTPSVTDNG